LLGVVGFIASGQPLTLSGPGQVALLLCGLLGLLALGLWPPKLPDGPPEILLRRPGQPELFGWLDGLADRVGAPRVDQVALFNQINAFATEERQKGRWVRMVGMGIPLLELLSKDEFSAVMAHELGHLRHRDAQTTWVSHTAWMWETVVSRMQKRGSPLFRAFARWFLPTFWLHSNVLRRLQEKAADAASTAVVPPEAQARQLLRTRMLLQLLPAALHEGLNRAARETETVDLDPVRLARTELGRMSADRIADAYRDVLEEKPNWLSTHPDLRTRLSDLGVAVPAQVEIDFAPDEPACGIVRGYEELRSLALQNMSVNCQVRVAKDRRFFRGSAARAERVAEHEKILTAAGQVLIGRLLCRLQRFEEAWPHLQKALELEPENLSTLLDLCGTLYDERRYQQALDALKAYLPAATLDFEFLMIGARSAERCGALEDARDFYRRLLTMDLPLAVREDLQERIDQLGL
jgi:Zn-dependent protease with chaperone function